MLSCSCYLVHFLVKKASILTKYSFPCLKTCASTLRRGRLRSPFVPKHLCFKTKAVNPSSAGSEHVGLKPHCKCQHGNQLSSEQIAPGEVTYRKY